MRRCMPNTCNFLDETNGVHRRSASRSPQERCVQQGLGRRLSTPIRPFFTFLICSSNSAFQSVKLIFHDSYTTATCATLYPTKTQASTGRGSGIDCPQMKSPSLNRLKNNH